VLSINRLMEMSAREIAVKGVLFGLSVGVGWTIIIKGLPFVWHIIFG